MLSARSPHGLAAATCVLLLLLLLHMFAGICAQNLLPALNSTDWQPYGSGFVVDTATQRQPGIPSIRLENVSPGVAGAAVEVRLNQTTATPLQISCWSRAANVTGGVNADYSLYVDAYYRDGGALFGFYLPFETGTHDFELGFGILSPELPIETLRLYLLLRYSHSGTVWFEGCAVQPEPGRRVPTGGAEAAGPVVASLVVPPEPVGTVPLRFRLVDAESRRCTLRAQVCLDRQRVCRPLALHPAPMGLDSSPQGVPHELQWDASRDLGFHARTATLRLSAYAETDALSAPQSGPISSASIRVPYAANLLRRLRQVNTYLIDYSEIDAKLIGLAQQHDLVIIHPTQSRRTITRQVVQAIQQGVDPVDPADDPIVLGYITIGEDDRTVGVSPEAMATDPRFRGDGTGPRIDPRGPGPAGRPLDGINPLGLPSNGGTGYASYYVDDNSVFLNGGRGDGIPDRNAHFGGCFVNAGDPAWFNAVRDFTLDGVDRTVGLRELMHTDYGRGLGADGIFMDTFDTPAPDHWTDRNSPVLSKFEWTAPGFQTFTRRLDSAFPDKVILQNRGLFFFDPQYHHYKYSTRPYIDIAYFESFRLNSNFDPNIDPFAYPENRYVTAPRLMAEANRPDGFRVLSLGYAGGRGAPLTTLTGQTQEGRETFLEDIRVTDLQGFRHYITDAAVAFANTFVRDNSDFTDTEAPQWTSTYNDNGSGRVFGPPTPRIGIQEAVRGEQRGEVVLRWDVTLDKYPGGYRLYYQDTAFNFTQPDPLRDAQTLDLLPVSRIPALYYGGVGPGSYPYEASVTGLQSGRRYYFLVRAYDRSPQGSNEDGNTVVLSAVAP